MAHRLVFNEKGRVRIEAFEVPPVGPEEVRVRSHCSLMSTGTENIIFNRLFESGSHWDNWIKYPFYPGYLNVGEVVEVGSEVKHRKVGDRVAMRKPHASEHVVPEEKALPVPDGIDLKEAAWFGLGKIAFMGARVSDYRLGGSVLIVGAGPIGQMSVRWAVAAGLEHVVVVDPVESRLQLARVGGATATISKSVFDCREDVLAAFGGKLPEIVNDATGNTDVFSAALGLAAKFGRVVILGDTGTPTGQHLTADVITRGLTIVGAHDMHVDEVHNDATITRLFFDLVKRGKFSLEGLNTHSFLPEHAQQAYDIANAKRGETMGIVFDWTH
ncbi:zinc-binding alcohol dehydrogenase [bacterium]|nr:MAG: zinc-binding alcohol dehydrogenase [bacterium]